MKLKTFKQKIENGEITDFHPYLTAKPISLQVEMARCGILVDELVALNRLDVTVALVRHGHAQKFYAEWVISGHKDVRRALASRGYAPDILIKDRSSLVRMDVFTRHPEYIKYVVHTKIEDELRRAVNVLKEQIYIEWDIVESVLNNPLIPSMSMHDYTGRDEIKALELKYATRELSERGVSTLEKTMTPLQSFLSGDNVWKLNASGSAIYRVQQCEDELRALQREDLFRAVLTDKYGVYQVKSIFKNQHLHTQMQLK